MRVIAAQLREECRRLLPDTYEVLRLSNLTVHDAVYRVVLSGSRGIKGGWTLGSDIDLTLLVDSSSFSDAIDKQALLGDIVELTLSNWESKVGIDTAAVFDKYACGLICFERNEYMNDCCHLERPDCLGIYKTQKGFHGMVPNIGLQISDVYPILTVWNR
jgi:hypothetical protein